MNPKVLASLAGIALVAAIAGGATVAYFSDTETSTGNTFAAGSIDLQVDSACSYNGQSSDQCGSWALKDLDPTADKFFNFTNVKPGDQGENTISLHTDSIDALACLYISPLQNTENSCVESETEEEGDCGPAGVCDAHVTKTACVADTGNSCAWEVTCDDDQEGELAENITFFAWDDNGAGANAGNNVWDDGELPLFADPYFGPASDVLAGKTYPLGALTGGVTKYVGIKWCAGNMDVVVDTETINCNGEQMGNEAQSDSMTASIALSVLQQANGVQCPDSPF